MRNTSNALAIFASFQLVIAFLSVGASDSYEITVKRGETLLALAARHGATQAEILAVNPGLKADVLKTGEKLRIPRTYRGVIDGSIECRRGDTLSLIALRVGVTVEELVRLNRIENGHVIVPGQRLRVPAKTPVTKPSGFAGFAQQFLTKVPETPPVEDPTVKLVAVKFDEDASLEECASALGVSKENLLQWNADLADGRIVPAGVPLKIPGVLVGRP